MKFFVDPVSMRARQVMDSWWRLLILMSAVGRMSSSPESEVREMTGGMSALDVDSHCDGGEEFVF